MLKELIEYECPNCHAGYGALERRAGMETGLIRALVEHFRSSFTKLFLALRGYAKRF
jgi:hypothetical protein